MTRHKHRFRARLVAAAKSAHTIAAYARNMRLFSEWFALTNGKAPSPEGITPVDVREYREHLPVVKNHDPATANRKPASLSAFC